MYAAIRMGRALTIALMFGLAILAFSASFGAEEGRAQDMKSAFEKAYDQWRDLMNQSEMIESSGARIYGSEPFQRIVELGPPAVPYIIEAMRDESYPYAFHLRVALSRISRRRWVVEGVLRASNARRAQMWAQWWQGGQKLTDEMFTDAYKVDDVKRIAALGWGAMPRIVEKLKEGDEDLMKAVRQIALVEVRLKRIPSEAVEDSESWIAWWEKNKGDWAIPFPDLQKEKDKEADGETAPDQEEAPQDAES